MDTAEVINQIVELMSKFGDDDRVDIINGICKVYCDLCGTQKPDGTLCWCWNDE